MYRGLSIEELHNLLVAKKVTPLELAKEAIKNKDIKTEKRIRKNLNSLGMDNFTINVLLREV